MGLSLRVLCSKLLQLAPSSRSAGSVECACSPCIVCLSCMQAYLFTTYAFFNLCTSHSEAPQQPQVAYQHFRCITRKYDIPSTLRVAYRQRVLLFIRSVFLYLHSPTTTNIKYSRQCLLLLLSPKHTISLGTVAYSESFSDLLCGICCWKAFVCRR